ncbi:hypothetical protein [Actinophytocola sp.]|uniref:hypothetical protein n=1 Tax=Actinophytocola sp. TaxID=1872138 RepID=UPI003D6AD062
MRTELSEPVPVCGALFGDEWFAGLVARTASDGPFAVAARQCDCVLGLFVDTTEHWVRLHAGGMERHPVEPLGHGWRFGFMAPLATWRQVCQPVPPPLHADLFSLVLRVPEFLLLGDRLALMQNAAAVQRWLTLFRSVAP